MAIDVSNKNEKKVNLTGSQIAVALISAHETLTMQNDLYNIGVPGTIGFGVGAIPVSQIPTGMFAMEGHYDKSHANYGNVIDSSGSIMVAIPKFYYKIVENSFLVSSAIPKFYYKIVENSFLISAIPLADYVLDRMFINAGVELDYVLVDKYSCGNVNGIFTSKAGIDPCSTNTAHNPIGSLINTPSNTNGGLYKAVKTRGVNHFLTSIFIYSALARLAKAHGDAATVATCAFKDVAPYLPKGNNNNALKDTNDASVTYEASGYSNCGKTRAITNFAKTTHNGQNSGVADLNGNMYEVASGFIRTTALGFLVLKETVDIASFTSDSTTVGGFQAYDTNLYDVIDLSDLIPSNETGSWTNVGNGVNQVFGMSTDRSSAAYKRTSILMPLATGVVAGGTTEFGSDGIYKILRDGFSCLVGLSWSNGSAAGVFASNLSGARSFSNDNVGGRASLNVKMS